ncbi:peptidoglycan DD-metalloendopeptidase family protein [Zobellella maritima]|uniref:peptidoglycan DD-metalloendopeptidase family protein n=1 Tax=Zobellella maritima TaxID=2059725 RepID=UPI000E300A22|nr:peptidoglycan DD-metalloendopeptidase family protein [Zobellella maritima]
MSGLPLFLWSWLLLLPMSINANIYRYQDASGVIHYTDSYLSSVDFEPDLWLEDEINEDGVLIRVLEKPDGHYFFALNRLFGPAKLTLSFPRQENVQIPERLLQAIRLAPREEKFIGKLTPLQPGHWRYDYGFAYMPGKRMLMASFDSRLDENRVRPRPEIIRGLTREPMRQAPELRAPAGARDIGMPFIGRYRITQGFNGDYSHHRTANRYALDIALPVGTPLVATKDGIVMDAVDHHVGGGLKAEYRRRTNYLRLLHDDGTMSLYAHIQTGSILVPEGARVRAGERVAASGNTGYSSGPHLHFALQINNGKGLESIPFTLEGRHPEPGNWLLARE